MILPLLVVCLLACPGEAYTPRTPTKPFHPPLYPTAYSWLLADGSPADGTINCDSSCSDTAILPQVGDELFGHVAACPTYWLGWNSTTVLHISWDGGGTWEEWWCVDSFGRPEDRTLVQVDGQWVIRIDFAMQPPTSFPYHGVIRLS